MVNTILSASAVALGAAAALLVVVCLGCDRPPEVAAPRHLFLITVDTLRADHMSLYGYPRPTTPRLDGIARRGVVFDRAIAQWPKTGSSLASLFSGRYPQTTGLTHEASVRLPEELRLLPEVLSANGFATLGVVTNAVLAKDLGWSRGFGQYVETWSGRLTEDPVAYRDVMWAGRVNELAAPLLRAAREEPRLFVWLHYSDPHAPYLLPADVANPFLDDPLYREAADVRVDVSGRSGRRIGDADELKFYVAQYDANIRLVDQHIGEIVDLLDELGLLDESLLVLCSDHGEDLGEHRGAYFEHGQWPYNTTAHVPLVVVGPGVASGRRITAPVELVDLFPTLLSLLLPGTEVPGLEGETLQRWLAPSPERGRSGAGDGPALAFSESGRPGRDHYRSVQDERFKLIFRPQRRDRKPEIELYDLERDPLEAQNLAAADEEEVRRLRRHLLDWMAKAPESTGEGAASRERSEEEMRALKALGYVD